MLVRLWRMGEGNKGMSISPEVAGRMGEAVELLAGARWMAERGGVREALRMVNEARDLAESVLEDPTMVSLLYFPEEHKMAVLLPLWAPLALPIAAGLWREVRRFRELSGKKKR